MIIIICCSMLAVNTTCGRDTAVFTKHFLDRMATPLNQVSIKLCRSGLKGRTVWFKIEQIFKYCHTVKIDL